MNVGTSVTLAPTWGKICKIIDAEGMWFEIYSGDKLIEKIWMRSDLENYPIEESSSLIRKDKIKWLLEEFEKEK